MQPSQLALIKRSQPNNHRKQGGELPVRSWKALISTWRIEICRWMILHRDSVKMGHCSNRSRCPRTRSDRRRRSPNSQVYSQLISGKTSSRQQLRVRFHSLRPWEMVSRSNPTRSISWRMHRRLQQLWWTWLFSSTSAHKCSPTRTDRKLPATNKTE